MSSETTDANFLQTFQSLDFYVIFDKNLSKSQKFERLFQHGMPTLEAWALASSLMIWLPGAIALLPILYQISSNSWDNLWGFCGVSLSIVVGGFMLPLVLGFLVAVSPVIYLRARLANRGLFFYWTFTFAVYGLIVALGFFWKNPDKFLELATLWQLLLILSPRIFGFFIITFLYLLYRPHQNPPNMDTLSSLDEHLTN